MISKALNAQNDIFVENGSFRTTSDGAEVAQHVRTRLQFFEGEWFLDLSAGIPWIQDIFTRPANLVRAETLIKNEITTTPGVLRLIEFEVNFDNASRRMFITGSAQTDFGTIDLSEVTINA